MRSRKRSMLFAVLVVIVAMGGWVIWGLTEVVNERVASDELIGTWVSSNPDAPGTLTLREDGTAQARNLTVFDRNATDPIKTVAVDLAGEGEWAQFGYNLQVILEPAAGGEVDLALLIISSPFRGTTIRAIVGDPDGPALQQIFRRE